MEEFVYRFTFSWPWCCLEVNGQLHVPATLLPGRGPFTHGIGGCVGTTTGLDYVRRENSLPYRDSKYSPSVVKPVTSRYTDCAISVRESKASESEKRVWLGAGKEMWAVSSLRTIGIKFDIVTPLMFRHGEWMVIGFVELLAIVTAHNYN
jgi:hypothetical protein